MDYSKLTKEECIDLLQDRDQQVQALRENAERYRAIFNHAYVSLWEEDCSEVRKELDRLRAEGIEDIRTYLRHNPQKIGELVRKIKILDVNEATVRLYGATSKSQLLGSLEDLYVSETEGLFIEEMTAIAERRYFFEGETMGRTLKGEPLHLLIRMSIPYGRDEHDYVLVSMVDITSRKKREEEYARLLEITEKERTRAESLRKVTLALNATFDTSRILDIILNHARRLVSFTGVNVSIREEGEMRLVRFHGYQQYGVTQREMEKVFNDNRRRLDNLKQIIEEKKPVLISNTAEDPNWVFFERMEWVRSFLGIPLMYGNELIGMINFDSNQPGHFTREDIRNLKPFAHAAAVALQNAHLYGELERELEERNEIENRLRASLQEKKVLLEEIHHRVKNNLNVVASMLSLQMGRISSVEEALEALRVSENRIHSMSLIHDNLYQSDDLSAIDMRSYLETITEDLRQIYAGEMPVEINTVSDAIYLDIYQAIPLGLILNELVSNALEHAFCPESGGNLSITLQQAGEGQCELRVRDNGCGLSRDIDLQETETIGLKLVSVLSEQLGGSLTLLREGGTEFQITFPATSLS
jgi:two-component sensor histidine kinase